MPLPHNLPADAHGDALRRLVASGDNLTLARPVEFAFVFGQPSDARRFGTQARAAGFLAPDTGSTEVIVSVDMVPTYAVIIATDTRLAALAAENGGRSDGWGCFSLGLAPTPSA